MSETGDFRIAGAYTEIYLKDTTEADWQKIKAGLEAKGAIQLDTRLKTPDVTKVRDETQAKLDANPVKVPAKLDGKSLAAQAAAAGSEGGSVLTAAWTAATVLGAPLAGSALLAGVGAGVIGVAALAEKGNAQVQRSYQGLARSAESEFKAAAASTAPVLAQAASEMTSTLAGLRPELTATFAAARPDIQTFVTGLDDAAQRAMPGLLTAVQNGEPVIQGASTLLGQLSTTGTQVLTGLSSNAQAYGTALASTGSIVQSAGGLITRTLNDVTTAYANNSGQIDSTIKKLADDAGNVVDSALPGVSAGLGGITDVADGAVHALGGVDTLLGTLGGYAAAGFGAFKLAGIAGTQVERFGGYLEAAGVRARTTAINLGASTQSAATMGLAFDRAGGFVSKLGSSLPFVGTALVAADAGFHGLFGSTDQLAQGVQGVGDQFEKATGQLGANDDMVASATRLWGPFGRALGAIIPTSEKVNEQITQQQQGMSQATIFQQQASRSLEQYNLLLKTHGAQDELTKSALEDYTAEVGAAEDAQNKLANATKTAVQAAADQMNQSLASVGAGLNLQASLLQLKSDQDAVTQATKGHGAASDAARQAEVGYEQQLLAVVTAAGKKAAADNAGKTASEQAQAATDAEAGMILQLAAAAGKNAPPALKQLVGGLSDAEIQSFRSTGAIKGTHTEIVKLPSGKTITINVDDKTGAPVANIKRRLGSLPKSTFLDVYLNTVLSPTSKGVQTKGVAGLLGLGHATGGIDVSSAIGFASGALADPVRMSSSVATVVPPRMPRIIGDNLSSPEAFIPLNGSQRSRQILATANQVEGMAPAGPRTVVNNTYNITQAPMEDGYVLARRLGAQAQWDFMTTVR